MANKFRSSFEIKLNGADYTLRPSFEAIMEFTDKTGLDIFEALQECQKGFKVKVIVASIWAGIVGESRLQKENPPTFERIGRECQSQGFENCVIFCTEFLSRAVASDDRVKKIDEVMKEAPQTET
jgi:hypothetical protein